MSDKPNATWPRPVLAGMIGLTVVAAVVATVHRPTEWFASPPPAQPSLKYQRRLEVDVSGYHLVHSQIQPWDPQASLAEISHRWQHVEGAIMSSIDQFLRTPNLDTRAKVLAGLDKARILNHAGKPKEAYQVLQRVRSLVEGEPRVAEERLFTIIYCQGVTALRLGENDNCILCRGESSCILPLSPAAVHTNPTGSRQAIEHFTEYLRQFPDDVEVRWLMNLAYMTLGEYPERVDPRQLIPLDRFRRSEFDIGRFRDIGQQVGVGRLNQAGGAIMEDFDNDGLFDIAITCFDPTQPMALYRNKGDGTFEDRTERAGLSNQPGGLYCVQVDYNNDGHMDIYVTRGAWVPYPMRPSLLRNNGDGTFTDVTKEAGLLDPVNSIAVGWADYDNDGYLDLFVCCERQVNRLYHNKRDGTFEEVSAHAGVRNTGKSCKGIAWIDFDNDGYPDLFLNHLAGTAQLYRNNRDGTFANVTVAMGIKGPEHGFSCWAWDFDNDGWLDIFATSYLFTLEDVVKGLQGQAVSSPTSKLYRNLQGKGFEDVSEKFGVAQVFATMGSNFGDFDNDGYLDIYLGTGSPDLDVLVPNRMFKNVAGQRFAEITASSGTGQLQKGHGVACGDWDRNGTVDLFLEMGGAINGDKYHNILFQNPGQGNNWLSVKLVGKKTNRAAVGARIKLVTAGPEPLTIHRHVSSGSSFGANPMEQHIGLGKADRVARLEIHWPTSGTTQVFTDLTANQTVVITEFAEGYEKRPVKPIPLPRE